MNGYNFTERVRKILALAREESQHRHHEYVGTEHLLLALIAEGEGVGAAVLQNLDIDLSALKARIEGTIKPGNGAPQDTPDLPYTSRAKKCLELAMSEARDFDHSYVGSEHLLLGLLGEERGIAAQVLAEAGATVASLRSETLRLLGTDQPSQRNPAPAGNIESVAIDVRLTDGSTVRGEFRSVAAALHFLKQMGYSAARRYES